MEWIKGHGHKAYEVDGADDEEDDAGDVEENDVAMMKLKATESIFIWYIRGGGYQKRTSRLHDISHIIQRGMLNIYEYI